MKIKDLLKEFGEYAWIEFHHDVRFFINSFENQKINSQLYKSMHDTIVKNDDTFEWNINSEHSDINSEYFCLSDLPHESFKEIHAYLISNYVLFGWSGIVDDKMEEIEFDRELAFALLRINKKALNFITKKQGNSSLTQSEERRIKELILNAIYLQKMGVLTSSSYCSCR